MDTSLLINSLSTLLSSISSAIAIILAIRSLVLYLRLRNPSPQRNSTIVFSFPLLSATNKNVANALSASCAQLASLGKQGTDAAKRLNFVGENLADNSIAISTVQNDLNPPLVGEKVYEESTAGSRNLNLLKNLLVITPLFVAWTGLSVAASHFDTSSHQKPLVSQWLNAFGTGNPFLSFYFYAALIAALFALLIFLATYTGWVERRATRSAKLAEQLLDDAIFSLQRALVDRVGEGATQISEDAAVSLIRASLNRMEALLTHIASHLVSIDEKLGSSADE